MIPETYNVKNKSSVKVCKTCNYLATAFRHALLSGNYELAQSIYMTGNINLRCPFMNVKKGNEVMLPVHCATEGGSLKVLTWLVDVHHCPLKMINTGNRNKTMSEELIGTSQYRTVLDIAIVKQKVDILRYLVQQKKVPVNDRKNKNHASLVALETVLKAFPEAPPYTPSMSQRNRNYTECGSPACSSYTNRKSVDIRNVGSKSLYEINDTSDDDSFEYIDNTEEDVSDDADDEQSVSTTVQDPCVICYEKTIDCVLTPCGHQICCLECSKEMSKCPICTSSFESIRIFRP